MGEAEFKYAEFVVIVDKNIYKEFKSTHRAKKIFRVSLKSSNIFANTRIYALCCKGWDSHFNFLLYSK